MSFLKDTLSIFKKSELVFIEKVKESQRVYSFLFKKDQDLTWKPGQHGLFTITHKKIKNHTKPFTVSSIPSEGVVRLTTTIGENPSDFKQALLELEPGMKINMSGPVGSFYLKEKSPALFIAADIGITPFRAIIKQIEGENIGKQVKLLYFDSENMHIYKVDFKNVDVDFITTKEQLLQEINIFKEKHKEKGQYFVAGSKDAVNMVVEHLKSSNIAKRAIKKDVFVG
ncbi:FAD-dependent oxidoreductase [Sutcliffiella horikoshii]|uniref:FAD-dependent oxidoreductase n=1 Tax=Sutcliffiella horikoshii TaxID=79883 RepID=UPI001F36F43D|nr:FAD-dependent oxidoreductase [Sutcliffiella horikoshii]MCG1023573.1 FAD-dependent oxidoreductase [Sutcliffiella horikoshii]